MVKTKQELDKEREKEYFDYFFSISDGSYKECWIETEIWYGKCYGCGRFSTYESFRVIKGRYLKALSKKTRK